MSVRQLPISDSRVHDGVLFFALFIVGAAEVVAGPLMVLMSAEFGVESRQIAYLPAAYGLAYGAFALVLGPFSDRFSRKLMLQIGLAGFSAFSLAITSASGLANAVGLSAALGGFAALVQPNTMALVSDMSTPDELDRRIGLVIVGLMTGLVVTPAVAGLLGQHFGWRSVYMALAATSTAVLLSLSLAFCGDVALPRAPPRGLLRAHKAALATPGALRRLTGSYFWFGWLAGFGAVVAEVCVQKLGMRVADAGLMAAGFGGVIIVGNLAGHIVARLLGGQALSVVAALSALGVAAFALPMHSPALLFAAGAPWAFFYGCGGPLHHTQLSALSDQSRGALVSYHASLLNLGIFSTSILMAIVGTAKGGMTFCLLVSCVTLAGASILPRRRL